MDLPAELSAVERWAVFVAALAAGLTALGVLAVRARRAYCRARDLLRDALARARVLAELVEHELNPNTGGSLHDMARRTDARTKRLLSNDRRQDRRLDALEEHIGTMAHAQRDMWPAIRAVAESEPPHDDKEDMA